jgi:hypothetical protein
LAKWTGWKIKLNHYNSSVSSNTGRRKIADEIVISQTIRQLLKEFMGKNIRIDY